MKDDTLSSTDQIEALLSLRASALAESLRGRVESAADYCAVFNVTTPDVLAYVRLHGVPPEVYACAPDSRDGFYCLQDDGGFWWVYWQERGACLDEVGPLPTQAKAMKELALLLLHFSGTGIDFNRVPEDLLRGHGGFPVRKFSGHGGNKNQWPDAEKPAVSALRWPGVARLQGLGLLVTGYALMIATLQLGIEYGTPEATGSVQANWGLMMLMTVAAMTMRGFIWG